MTKDLERALRRAVTHDYRDGAREVADRLAEAAGRAGLLDVAYAVLDAPVGTLVAARTPRGLVALSYADSGVDAVLTRLAARVSPRVLHAPARLDDVRRELEEYFSGARRDFDLAIDWSLTRGFGRKVLRATARIPFGSIATYAEVARRAGSPNAYRAAGNALAANPIPIVVPCHRVVRTGGDLGGYTGGLDKKRRLLAIES
jgi:methylated-DNA-[protein]-cysteine S-methyltransferase